MGRLTKEQKAYIRDNPNVSPAAAARKFQCTPQTINLWLHHFHGDTFFEKKQKEKEAKFDVIREMYPNYTASEIASVLGTTKAVVNGLAIRLGVKHSQETNERIYQENLARIKNPEAIKKRIETLNKTIRIDRFRANSGLKQKTKRKFKTVSNKSLCARHYLIRRYNYFYDKDYGELLTIFYDDETERLSPEREQHYTDMYHIKFERAED